MAGDGHGGQGLDHYQLLGVARGASREEVAQAWRRRARAEHPDARPGEAGDEAAGRFRALAEAYHVLSDPARRAAYDRGLTGGRAAAGMPPPVPVPVRQGRPGGATGPSLGPGPPLRAGPVRVDGPPPAPASRRDEDEDEVRLAVLAALALRCLARDPDRGWPW